jgi:hypothetical protein
MVSPRGMSLACTEAAQCASLDENVIVVVRVVVVVVVVVGTVSPNSVGTIVR